MSWTQYGIYKTRLLAVVAVVKSENFGISWKSQSWWWHDMMKVRGLKASNGAPGWEAPSSVQRAVVLPEGVLRGVVPVLVVQRGVGQRGLLAQLLGGEQTLLPRPSLHPHPPVAVVMVIMVMVMMVMVTMIMIMLLLPPRVPQRHQPALARGDTDCPPRLQIKMLNITTHITSSSHLCYWWSHLQGHCSRKTFVLLEKQMKSLLSSWYLHISTRPPRVCPWAGPGCTSPRECRWGPRCCRGWFSWSEVIDSR